MTDKYSDLENAAREAHEFEFGDTPAPWEFADGVIWDARGDGIIHRRFTNGVPYAVIRDEVGKHIALANPSRILSLIEDVRRLEAENDELRKERNQARTGVEVLLDTIETACSGHFTNADTMICRSWIDMMRFWKDKDGK